MTFALARSIQALCRGHRRTWQHGGSRACRGPPLKTVVKVARGEPPWDHKSKKKEKNNNFIFEKFLVSKVSNLIEGFGSPSSSRDFANRSTKLCGNQQELRMQVLAESSPTSWPNFFLWIRFPSCCWLRNQQWLCSQREMAKKTKIKFGKNFRVQKIAISSKDFKSSQFLWILRQPWARSCVDFRKNSDILSSYRIPHNLKKKKAKPGFELTTHWKVCPALPTEPSCCGCKKMCFSWSWAISQCSRETSEINLRH